MHKITLILFLVIGTASLSQDYKFGKVSKEELKEESHPIDPDADAAILYREQYSHIDYNQGEGFLLVTEIFERIKIYNADGFEWGTHEVPVYQGSNSLEENIFNLKGVTYSLVDGDIEETKLRNDGIFKEELSKFYSVEKFTMPNLKPGCIIEYRYKVNSPFLSNIDEIRLQEEIPLNKAEVSFNSPEWLMYKMHRKGLQSYTVEETSKPSKINYRVTTGSSGNGFSVRNGKVEYRSIDYQNNSYKISVENVPAMQDEVFSSNIDNYRSAVKFELSYTKYPNEPIETITSNWEAVSKTIYDSEDFGGQLKNDRFFNDDVDRLLANATDPEEKIVLIFEYVKQKMNWNKYMGIYADEGIRSAYKSGVGNTADINLLLVCMLRYAGLDANPVILSTRNNGIPLFPTRNGFNDVIAGVTLEGTTLLMDATRKMGAVNLLEEELLNWNGRLIRENGSSEWVNLYPTSAAEENTMVSAELGENLEMTGKIRSRFTGHYGLSYRKNFSGKSDQESLEALEDRYSSIEINDLEIKNRENLYEPVEVNYGFEIINSVEEIGDKLYFSPLFHLSTQENPFKSEERKHPVDFKYPWKDRFIVSIKVADGYNVESLPEGALVNLSDNMGTFKYLVSNKSGFIQISSEISLNTSIIAPWLYSDLKKFYEFIVNKQSEKIVLSKIQ